MSKLQQAIELVRLVALSRDLLTKTQKSLELALQDPGSTELLREAVLNLEELKMVQIESKEKLANWNE